MTQPVDDIQAEEPVAEVLPVTPPHRGQPALLPKLNLPAAVNEHADLHASTRWILARVFRR